MTNSGVARRLTVSLLIASSTLMPLYGARARLSAVPVAVDVPVRPRPVATEGGIHLIYELHLTNFKSTPVEIASLSIRDSASHRELVAYSASELSLRVKRIGASAETDSRTLAPGSRTVVFLDVKLPAHEAIPKRLVHRLSLILTQADGSAVTDSLEDEGVETRREPPLVVRPPLEGDRWLAMNGLSNTSSHRRAIVLVNGRARIAQRFATDWTRLGADGQAFHGDPANNANWYAYGAIVRAVASGTVVDRQDGIPENDPTAGKMAVPITLETVAGNYLIIDIGNGHYAFYAHLQPGSLKVRLGQEVRAGQAIAKLGNSGNSDAPHLHFHIGDHPSPLAAEGLPYVITRFALLGHVPSLKVLESGEGWHPTESAISQRTNEIPFQNAVVRFIRR